MDKSTGTINSVYCIHTMEPMDGESDTDFLARLYARGWEQTLDDEWDKVARAMVNSGRSKDKTEYLDIYSTNMRQETIDRLMATGLFDLKGKYFYFVKK